MCLTPITLKLKGRSVVVPCGHCAECDKSRVNQFRIKAMCQAYQTLKSNGSCYFLTLTYNPESLPHDCYNRPCFDSSHITNFFKRLRKRCNNLDSSTQLKYLFVSEFGSKKGRPHYHALIFINHNNFTPLDFACLVKNEWSINTGTNRKPCYHSLGFTLTQPCVDIVRCSNYISKYISKAFDKVQVSQPIKYNYNFYKPLPVSESRLYVPSFYNNDDKTFFIDYSSEFFLHNVQDICSDKSSFSFDFAPFVYKRTPLKNTLKSNTWHTSSLCLGYDYLSAECDSSNLSTRQYCFVGTDAVTKKQTFYNYSLPKHFIEKKLYNIVRCRVNFPYSSDFEQLHRDCYVKFIHQTGLKYEFQFSNLISRKLYSKFQKVMPSVSYDVFSFVHYVMTYGNYFVFDEISDCPECLRPYLVNNVNDNISFNYLLSNNIVTNFASKEFNFVTLYQYYYEDIKEYIPSYLSFNVLSPLEGGRISDSIFKAQIFEMNAHKQDIINTYCTDYE